MMAALWSPPGTPSFKGKRLAEVRTPAFVIQKKVAERNCQTMLETCRSLNVKLRCQTKTHKTIEGAILQTGGTRRGLVTSTLDECEFLADRGCDDILFGYQFTGHDMERMARLARHLEEFHVMVDSEHAVELLVQTQLPEGRKWSAFLKVDCGKLRAGVWHGDVPLGAVIVRALTGCSHVTFKGVYVHCGDTYTAATTQQLDKIRDANIGRLLAFSEGIEQLTGVKCPEVGVGSTPSCMRPSPQMAKLTELHPGNYVFLDAQQYKLGSCTLDDVAGTVATRVIGHYPRRNQLLVDCGFTGMTMQGASATGYGLVRDHPELRLCDMNQEHGFIEPVNNKVDTLAYDKFPVGTMLFLIPYHSCATAAMYSKYLVVEDDLVVEEWIPTRGW